MGISGNIFNNPGALSSNFNSASFTTLKYQVKQISDQYDPQGDHSEKG